MSEKTKKTIVNQLNNNRNVSVNYTIDDVQYIIMFMGCNKERDINICSILIIPQVDNPNNQIVLESNNLESDKLSEILEQGCQTGIKLAKLTSKKPTPIIVPLIPSYKDSPYFQQLSKECFELSNQDLNYRIDEQVKNLVHSAKDILSENYNIQVQNKILINGYSSSAVFAQRFALLHPELIDTASLGGASGSIPIPTKKIEYPIGISDYKNLFGKDFDFENYMSIKFRYYVGELELKRKTESRLDGNGNPAPMHDMSYFDRSVPTNTGKKQREVFGQDMFKRANKTIDYLNTIGLDIKHNIYPGRTHNNINGQSVNELGDEFFKEVYMESLDLKKENNNVK